MSIINQQPEDGLMTKTADCLGRNDILFVWFSRIRKVRARIEGGRPIEGRLLLYQCSRARCSASGLYN